MWEGNHEGNPWKKSYEKILNSSSGNVEEILTDQVRLYPHYHQPSSTWIKNKMGKINIYIYTQTYTSTPNTQQKQTTQFRNGCCAVLSLSRVQLFATSWTAALQALSFTISQSLLKFISIESGIQSILKEINPEYSLKGRMLKLKHQYFGYMMQRWLTTGKDPDARKDWRQKEKEMTENEMVRYHQWLKNGHRIWTDIFPNGQKGHGKTLIITND